jgi:hypothetical protein
LLQADHYRGELLVFVNGSQPVHAPFGLDVRLGPLWALVLLLIGVVTSRFVVPISKAPVADANTKEPRGTGLAFMLTGVHWRAGDKPFRWLIRPVGTLVLLLAAVTQGFELLYVNDGAFGDTGFLDYAKVFLWPFTADVVTRGLGNLPWK